jgi:hypothetical protein
MGTPPPQYCWQVKHAGVESLVNTVLSQRHLLIIDLVLLSVSSVFTKHLLMGISLDLEVINIKALERNYLTDFC